MKYNYQNLTYYVDISRDSYIGKCKEFPRIYWKDSTPEDAYQGILELMKSYLEEMYPEPKKIWHKKKKFR